MSYLAIFKNYRPTPCKGRGQGWGISTGSLRFNPAPMFSPCAERGKYWKISRLFLFLLSELFLPGVQSIFAADIAFIYPTEEAIRSGKPIIGSVIADGVLAPADAVLAAGGEVFVGLPGDSVKTAPLIRLDKDLNVALLRVGERVLNPELQAAHRKRSVQLQTFLPTQAIVDTSTVAAAQLDLGEALVSSGTPVFKISFNGAPITNNVVHFKAWLNKVKFSVTLVSISSETLRGFSVRLHGNPKLEFKSLETTLSHTIMPGYDFEYKNESVVKPGKAFLFPIEARGATSKDYEWILEVKSGDHIQQQKVFVHFD